MKTQNQLLIQKILERATAYSWSLQGLGMFRLYLSSDVRLHVWDNRFAFPNVSTIHSHPWDFTSEVISGSITDYQYHEQVINDEQPEPEGEGVIHYIEQQIVCGPGGGVVDGKKRDVVLWKTKGNTYRSWPQNSAYILQSTRIHESVAEPGTITMITRRFHEDTEHANVYYPVGTEWVSAEPREASDSEVETMSIIALEKLKQSEWKLKFNESP